jgi:hypothetical protein
MQGQENVPSPLVIEITRDQSLVAEPSPGMCY